MLLFVSAREFYNQCILGDFALIDVDGQCELRESIAVDGTTLEWDADEFAPERRDTVLVYGAEPVGAEHAVGRHYLNKPARVTVLKCSLATFFERYPFMQITSSPIGDPLLFPAHVGPRLYLSSAMIAEQSSELVGFTHMLNCAREVPDPATLLDSAELQYLRLNADDAESEDLSRFFEPAHRFLEAAPRAVVYCSRGVSRSASIVLAHQLLRGEHADLASALSALAAARPICRPNPAFMRQLASLADDLRTERNAHQLHLVEASTDDSALRDGRNLIRMFADSLPFRLDFQNFEDELAQLPGVYVAPRGGTMLVAYLGRQPVGVGALRSHAGRETGELKRVFVTTAARGRGVGQRICEALLEAARIFGYQELKLDTVADMTAAKALYKKMGFTACAPYIYNPLETAEYYELSLAQSN